MTLDDELLLAELDRDSRDGPFPVDDARQWLADLEKRWADTSRWPDDRIPDRMRVLRLFLAMAAERQLAKGPTP